MAQLIVDLHDALWPTGLISIAVTSLAVLIPVLYFFPYE
jgi:hypothetical protein